MLPITLRPNGRHAVVVGGGPVAARKAAALARAGFRLVVVAPEIVSDLEAMLQAQAGEFRRRRYREDDLEDAALVVAATGDDAANARVVDDARKRNALVCDAARPERGNVVMPAVERAGDITLAVDCGVPSFSKRIASEVAASLLPQHAAAAARLRQIRRRVKDLVPPPERGPLMRAMSALPIAALAAMNDDDAERAIAGAAARSQPA